MNNPVCAVCGHVNRVGAVACETCDARLGATGWAGADDEQPGEAREPFDSNGEPSWAAPDTSEPGGAWSTADDIPAPPFKSAGDVISPMLAVYRKHFTLVGILVLVTTLPQSLLQYGIIDMTGAEAPAGGGGALPAGLGLGNLLLWVLSILASALLSGSLVYAVVDLQRAGRSSARECLARGLKAAPKVFLVSLLYALVTGLGYLLLIVPGVIFSLMFAVCVPAAVVEGRGPVEALKRSKELTDGYKGLIFVTYFLWGLLVSVLSWVVVWSFLRDGNLDPLAAVLLQTTVLGMLSSTVHVLTVYIYLGLLREHRSGFQTNVFTHGPGAA